MSDDILTVEQVVEKVTKLYDETPEEGRRAFVSGIVRTYEDLYRRALRIAETLVAPASPERPPHLCGARGFSPWLGDKCPACDAASPVPGASDAE